MRCDSCSQPVIVQDELVCNSCYSRFHYVCAGYDRAAFMRMTYAVRVNWRCGGCRSEPPDCQEKAQPSCPTEAWTSPCQTPPIRCRGTSPSCTLPPGMIPSPLSQPCAPQRGCPPLSQPCAPQRGCPPQPPPAYCGGGMSNFSAEGTVQAYKLELLLREIDKARTEAECGLDRLQDLEGMKDAVDFAKVRVEDYEEKLTAFYGTVKEKNEAREDEKNGEKRESTDSKKEEQNIIK